MALALTYTVVVNACRFPSYRRVKEEEVMSDNKKKILEMLAQNKISADDAYRLLSAIDGGEGRRDSTN